MSPDPQPGSSIAPPSVGEVFHVKHHGPPPASLLAPASLSSRDTPPVRRLPRHWPAILALLVLLATLSTACERIAAPEGWAAPVTTGTEYYAQLDRGVLWAFHVDGTTVQRDWRYPPANGKLKFDAIYATPLIENNVLYLASHTGDVIALDPSNGQPLSAWGGAPVELKQNVVATPVFDGKHLFIATENGDVYSFDAANGQHTRILQGNGRMWSGPALRGNTMYLANIDDRDVRALNVATGAVEWSQSVGPPLANLSLAGNLLIVGSLDRQLHALDVTANGKEQWNFVGDGWFAAQPAVSADAVYATTLKGTAYAVNAKNGAQIWKFHQDGESFRARPVLVGSTLVLVSRDGMIYGLHAADGTEAWHHALVGQKVDADPLVTGSDVVIITNSGQLVRVNATTGDTQTLGASS
jgi:outer membrane protein assembly factor BamB